MSKLELLIFVCKCVGVGFYMAFERWLGKTSKVKANSLLDLLWAAIVKLLVKPKEIDMEKEIVGGNIGAVGAYDLDLKDAKLLLKVSLGPTPGVGAELLVSVDAEVLLKKVKEAIPGHFDDALIDGAIALLKK